MQLLPLFTQLLLRRAGQQRLPLRLTAVQLLLVGRQLRVQAGQLLFQTLAFLRLPGKLLGALLQGLPAARAGLAQVLTLLQLLGPAAQLLTEPRAFGMGL